MVKRKSKAVEETSALKLITEEEWTARELRHFQRLQDIKISLTFITEAHDDHNALQEKHRQEERWTHYLDCDGLPRPEWPPEIRRFLAQMRHEEALDEQNCINWTLSVNERSILSQNVFREDLTWKTLQDIRPDIGKLYDISVQRILEMLKRVDRVLQNELEMVHISEERAAEMLQMRYDLNEEIHVLFDKLTYRIICAPSAYMVYNDCTEANYAYKGDNYNFQVWCVKDVPIRFHLLDIPVMYANFDCLGITIQMPYSILCDNLTLQCVHTFFDPYSEKAKSFYIDIETDTSNISSGMVDIEDCLINEWLKQVEIQDEMIGRMEVKMQQYEEALELMQTKEGGQKGKEESKQPKPIKAPKQPQSLPEGMLPDPHSLFLDREEQQFVDFLNDSFHPRKLDLRQDEVNLRQYLILGGIYSVVFVRKPKHTDFEKFNITLHEDGRIIYIRQDVRITIEEEEPQMGRLFSSVSSRASKRRMTQSRSRLDTQLSRIQLTNVEGSPDLRLHLNDDEAPYFIITFKLPDTLFLWGKPIVCQYIEEEEEIIEIEEESQPLDSDRGKHKKKKNKAVSIRNTETMDDPEKALPKGKSQHERIEYHRPKPTVMMKLRAEPSNIYRPSVLEMLRRSTVNKEMVPGAHLENFEMTGQPLTHLQIRNIQRHCVPRILSSFKLPSEFREERIEELGAKRQGPLLISRMVSDKDAEEKSKGEDFFFSYEDQEAPERVYPVLKKREKILYHRNPFLRVHIFGNAIEYDDDYDDDTDNDDQIEEEDEDGTLQIKEPSIYGVLNKLEDIEVQYKTNYKKIMDQPAFAVKKLHKAFGDPVMVTSTHDASSTSRSKSRVPVRRSKLHLISKSVSESVQTGSESIFREEMELRDTDTISIKASTDLFRRSKKPEYMLYEGDDDNLYSIREGSTTERPKVIHWTTKYILDASLNLENRTITVKTDRVGLFGFAFKRYGHFPFRNWCIEPNDENPNEIVFTLDTFYVRVVLFISNKGIRGYVTDLTKEYTAKPFKHLSIEEPIFDFTDFRKRFQDRNLNIFAEHDAKFYIENGYYSMKLLALELHVYDAIAIHCKMMKFFRSDWNRLATRRNIILSLRNPKDISDSAEVTVRVTPDNSTFVEISELCSDDLDVFKLQYQSTWRNIGNYSDLHQVINSMYPHATDSRNRDPKLIYYIRKLLFELRPLSYS